MMWRTHLAIAVLLATVLTLFVEVEHVALFYACTFFGALLPDIDHEGSKINRLLPLTRIVGWLFKHRGFFHSVFPVLIIYGIAYSLGFEQIGVYVGFGYLTHLLGDSMTVLGVNYFHPLSSIKIRGFLRTGGLEESILFLGAVILSVVFYFF